jgi:hypothetical protein
MNMAYTEHTSETYKSMISISVEAMKSLLLINGGAVIAVLTYLGTINNPTLASHAALPLAFFIGGLIFSVFTFVCSYLTQYSLFNEEVRGEAYKGPKHQTFLCIGFVFLALCLASFVGGCIFSITLLSNCDY